MLRAVNNKNADLVDMRACGTIQVWPRSSESLPNGSIVKYFKLQMTHVSTVPNFDSLDHAGLFTPD